VSPSAVGAAAAAIQWASANGPTMDPVIFITRGSSTVVWLVSAPFSKFVHQKVVRNSHNFAEARKGYFLASD
jgi:hypothetical protein